MGSRSLDHEGVPLSITVLISGPFGATSLDTDSERCKTLLLLSGGIGITPMMSIANDLLAQHARGRGLTLVYSAWAVADKLMVGVVADGAFLGGGKPPLQQLETETAFVRPSSSLLPLSFQPDILRSHSLSLGSHTADDGDGRFSDAESGPSKTATPHSPQCGVDSVLHTEFYLTRQRPADEFAAAGIAPDMQPCLRFGRPDLAKIFKRCRDVALAVGERRVAVLVCGPRSLVRDASDLAFSASDAKLTFDFHSEIFEF